MLLSPILTLDRKKAIFYSSNLLGIYLNCIFVSCNFNQKFGIVADLLLLNVVNVFLIFFFSSLLFFLFQGHRHSRII